MARQGLDRTKQLVVGMAGWALRLQETKRALVKWKSCGGQ